MTPSPESRTIPVDLPVANLNKLILTTIGLLALPHIRLALEIFRKIFQAFFSCAWWDSYWLQSIELGTSWVQFLKVKRRVSRVAPCRPNSR